MKNKYTLLCIALHIAIITVCVYVLKFSDARDNGDVTTILFAVVMLLFYTYMISFEPRRLTFDNEHENKELSVALAITLFAILFLKS